MRLVLVTAAAVLVILLVAWLLPAPAPLPSPERQHTDYLGSAVCRECHLSEYEAWKDSVHARAFQPASASTVAGEFVGVEPVVFNNLTTIPVAWEDVITLKDGRQLAGTVLSETPEEVVLRDVGRGRTVARKDILTISPGSDRRQKQAQNRGVPVAEQAEYKMAIIEPTPAGQQPKVQKHPVAYVLGAGRQTQQYLTRLPDGRLQVLPLVWDTSRRLWYDHRRALAGPKDINPDSPYYWSGYEQTANLSCLQCHVSQLETNYEPRTDTYQSTWTEPGINCEVCHGPARKHVALTRGARKTGERPVDWGLKSPRALSAQARTDICAQCHSLRLSYVAELKPGEDYYDHFVPYLWNYQGRYWADGTPRYQNYQYLSLLESRCTRTIRGTANPLTCTDCHDPHRNQSQGWHGRPVQRIRRTAGGATRVRTTGTGFAGAGAGPGERSPASDRLCTRCHSDIAADVTAHTHHPTESPGSRCLNCHMPRLDLPMGRYTTDHRITIPVPQATQALEIPNACSDCHRSETPEWAARHFVDRYGEDPGGHFARTLTVVALSQSDAQALGPALGILADPEESRPLRAMVATLLATARQPRVQQALLQAALEAHPLVRVSALRALSSTSMEEHATEIAGLLNAPLLGVRLTAASRFTDQPELIDRLEADGRRALVAALDEAFAAASDQREHPGPGLDLARIRLVLGILGLAQRSDVTRQHRLVLEKQPDYVPARTSLARLYLRQQRFEEALVQFTALARLQPENLAAQVGAAQCLIPTGRAEEAVDTLEQVLAGAPRYIPAHLNLGLAYQSLGRTDQARAQWEEVLRLDPGNVLAGALLAQPPGGSQR